MSFGFATVVTAIKGGDKITINSNVPDAEVYLGGAQIGMLSGGAFTYALTPRDGKDKTFVLKKEGYKDATFSVTTKDDPMFWGNLLMFGPFGSSTDSWSTENDKQFTPSQFYLKMEKN